MIIVLILFAVISSVVFLVGGFLLGMEISNMQLHKTLDQLQFLAVTHKNGFISDISAAGPSNNVELLVATTKFLLLGKDINAFITNVRESLPAPVILPVLVKFLTAVGKIRRKL